MIKRFHPPLPPHSISSLRLSSLLSLSFSSFGFFFHCLVSTGKSETFYIWIQFQGNAGWGWKNEEDMKRKSNLTFRVAFSGSYEGILFAILCGNEVWICSLEPKKENNSLFYGDNSRQIWGKLGISFFVNEVDEVEYSAGLSLKMQIFTNTSRG